MASDKKNDDEPQSSKKRMRFLTAEDVVILRRVLVYAKPFQQKILLALAVGIFASVLTAINLVALIPVLNILFEDPSTYKERMVSVREKVVELEIRIEEKDSFFRSVDERISLLKAKIDLNWKGWVREKKEDAIYIMALLLVLAQIVKSLLDFASKYLLQKSFYLAVLRLKTDLYHKCLELDLPQLHKLTSGDLISRLNNDIRAVRLVFTTMIGDIVLAPFTIFALFGVLMLLNWRMTVVVMIGLPLTVLPIAWLGKTLRNMGRKDEEEDAKILGFTQETIQGLPIVKTFAAEQRELRRFRQLSREMAQRQIRREKIRLYGEPVVEVFASIAMAGVLCLGAYIVLKSSTAGMGPAAFLIYLGILTRFYPPIKRLTSTWVKLQKSLANAERIFEIIDLEPIIKEKPNAPALKPFADRITLDNVTFSYAPELGPVLKDFSLEIAKGRKIALVGETGAGKSTVIRLLPRLYDIDGGAIRIDGMDIRDVTLRSVRSQIAIVTQDPVLFNDTIYGNIAYGRPDASREEVIQAAKDACADEFIDKLPKGMDTVVGERGGSLSGGQKQRITIARALLADTPILVLDEATSALDNVSESLVQRAIERLMENRTVIVIAHRLSTVRKADEIIVMENGGIRERGTHEVLMELKGKYHELVTRPEMAGK